MFFETTIMEKTADLAMIQKTKIDTLHKEGKSQRVITERCGCLQSAVSKQLNAKLTGRKNLGRKRCTSNRDDRKLEKLSSKADSNTCESFTRSGLKLESVHQESPRSDVFRKRATKPLLNQRQRQKCLTWAVEKKNWTVAQWSSFQMKVNFAFHLEIKVPESGGEWRGTESIFLEVQCEVSTVSDDLAAMSSAGVGPLCFWIHSQRSHLPGNLEHFMLPSADKLYGDADFIFQQDLAPAHTAKGTKSWFNDHGCYCAWLASKLAWPEPHREYMGYCQEEDERHQTQQCRWPEGHCQRNLGFHTTSAVPQNWLLHATPNWGSN